AAVGLDRGRGLVGRVDADVARPPGRGVAGGWAADPADHEAVDHRVGVADRCVLGCPDLEVPAEQVAVEGHGAVEVGLDEVDPAGHPDGIVSSGEHGVSSWGAFRLPGHRTDVNWPPCGHFTPFGRRWRCGGRRVSGRRSLSVSHAAGRRPGASAGSGPGARSLASLSVSENRWLQMLESNPGHSEWYIERFRRM